MNTFILTKIKVQSINDVALPYSALNELRGDAIQLSDVYVCDDAHYEIMETNFHGKNYMMMNWFCNEKL